MNPVAAIVAGIAIGIAGHYLGSLALVFAGGVIAGAGAYDLWEVFK